MRLQLATWPMIEEAIKSSPGIIIPIGSTEQHGPTGYIGTDSICPETIAHGLGEERGILIGPTLSIGMSQHHMAFPGSMTLRPSTLIAVIRDVIFSLNRHGIDRFAFVNGHGGNIATAQAAFSEVYTESSLSRNPGDKRGIRCTLINWFELPGVQRIVAEKFGDSEGSHGTPGELSLAYYAHPQNIPEAEVSPKKAPDGVIYDADDYRRQFPDGRIGCDPTLASVDIGRQLYQTAIGDLAEAYDAFLATN